MELLLGAMVMAAWVMVAPRAIADVVATWRASKAGNFDFIDRDRDRRQARGDRRATWAEAWAARRRDRNQKAGGDGTFRPGAGDYAKDLYHGWWEDKLAKREARRGAREPFDPSKPTGRQRLTAAVREKVAAHRAKRQAQKGRHRGDPTQPPPTSPQAAGPTQTRACPDCGETMTRSPSGWAHPGGQNCQRTGRPYRPSPRPWSTVPDRINGRDAPAAPNPSGSARAVDPRPEPASNGRHRGQPNPVPRHANPSPPQPVIRTCPRCGGGMAFDIGGVCGDCAPSAAVQEAIGEAERAAERAGPRLPDPTVGPASNGSNPTITGGPTMTAPTVEEVQTNEALRRSLERIEALAKEAAEALAVYEAAQKALAAEAAASGDGTSAKKFDAAATAGVADINDLISQGTIAGAAEALQAIQSAASKAHGSLEKYQDSEQLVATENIDATVLEPTAS